MSSMSMASLPSLAARRAARRPDVREKLKHMALPLHPLVQVNTGLVHPAFPRTVLHFWLLTDDQLDALAHFYHQRTPGYWSAHYPCPVAWPREGLGLEDKRRKLGRFIGLRGCETPGVPGTATGTGAMPKPVCVGDRGDGGRCALDAQPFCYACSMRTVQEVLEAAATEETTTTTKPVAKRSSASSTRSSCYARRERSPSRPGTRSQSRNPSRSVSRSVSRPRAQSWTLSPSERLTMKDVVERAQLARLAGETEEPMTHLTVDDVVERAQMARLNDESEEALRMKLGYYQ